ncbi:MULTISPECIES: S-layer homology domain-containing protein [Bacillus]|uniref:S-layer protein n=2 Tax=Bacillus cereus group TaxID=86661 RepID=A0A9X6Z8W8_BACCE|nr:MULTISPECIES: S-layer homology domain-containing protein [Bacillus]OUB82216.1 S-layer protein [Bacillus thuringiensis serovar sinensis]HDR6314954.1 S-layer homology domain-containing protein [Bacillus thuringiensis]KAA0792718.1 S-layer homology domain-containing protein [Bacillus sp. BPN334]MBY7111439.1 S-layer homology domain-containing protein [Bacillus sp. 17RED48]MBY7123396.1 S-layer homology domain-containing protein [Bacillus sp. 16GRE42]
MKKKILKVATALTIMGGVAFSAEGNTAKAELAAKPQQASPVIFKDVPAGHWSYKAIQTLAEHEIMLGYGNGVFGFGHNVNREQVAALIYRALDLDEEFGEDEVLESPYNDIVDDNSTMFPFEVLAVTELGIFTGDENGNFRPKATLTRAEMAQVLTRAFGLQVQGTATFKDVPKGHWAENAINAVGSNGISVGDGKGNFAPNMKVTREQYAQFLFNSMFK